MSDTPRPPTPPPGSPPGTPPAGEPGIAHAPTARSFTDRVLGALRLDASVYEEIEHDPTALSQAAGVVAIAAVCAGIGGAAGGIGAVLAGVVASVIGWLLSTGIVWLIGVRFMGHTSDYPELLRTLGFASAPQLLLILAFVPVLGALVSIAVFFWGLAAYVVAVRQALDVETGRAVVVCVLAWGLAMLLVIVFGGLAGGCAGTAGQMG